MSENGVLVHIADVESGGGCNCICPSCKSPLVPVKGNKNQHHFRHKGLDECKGGLESAIHLAAKQRIMEKKQITLPRYVCTAVATDSKGLRHTESKIVLPHTKMVCFDSVQEEKELHGMKADILAVKESQLLIIEIYYRHKVDDQKIEKIKNANISAIEINLSDLLPEDVKDYDAFWAYINDPKHVEWLHNAKAHESVYPELGKRLAIRVQDVERKYEDLNAQMKNELMKDFKILKMLCNKQHRSKSNQELKKNPIWQSYGERYYPLEAWPDFLNRYVPDGDWIFSCDQRVWQAVIYNSFICNNHREPHFFIREIVVHIKNYCNVPRCLERLQESERYFPDLAPPGAFDNMPSPHETVRAYCNHLCELGMLEYTGDDMQQERGFDFKIIRKTPDPAKCKLHDDQVLTVSTP